ncbi:MAG: hypothetical protein QNJ98_01635 [Planctomycetota bacterium]|nr:hypothetical protein [Planctomycetota bacterium]
MPRAVRFLPLVIALLGVLVLPRSAGAHPHSKPPPMSLDFTMLESSIAVQLLIEVALAEDWIGEAWYQPEDPNDPEAVGALTKALLARFKFTIDDAPVELKGTNVVTLASFSMAGEEEGAETLKLELEGKVAAPAQRMHLVWTDFSGIVWEDKIEFPVMVEADRVADSALLSPEEPVFSWRRRPPEFDWAQPIASVSAPPPPKWSVPVASLGLAAVGLLVLLGLGLRGAPMRTRALGAGACLALGAVLIPVGALRLETEPLWGEQTVLPSTAQAEKIFGTLHKNIYRAFADPGKEETEREREERIYRELATSVTPDLIDPLFVEILESLVLRNENGVVCHVEKVDRLEGAVAFPAEAWAQHFHVDWHWRVLGSITHWGHSHRRANVYRARYLVQHDGGSWRIASITVKEHRRIEEDADGELTRELILLEEGEGDEGPSPEDEFK